MSDAGLVDFKRTGRGGSSQPGGWKGRRTYKALLPEPSTSQRIVVWSKL